MGVIKPCRKYHGGLVIGLGCIGKQKVNIGITQVHLIGLLIVDLSCV